MPNTRLLLIVLTLTAGAPAWAQVPSTLSDAVKEVALDKLMSALAESALKLPENAQAAKVKARPDWYAANLATVIKESGGKSVKVDRKKYPGIVEAVVDVKKAQYEVIVKYLLKEAASQMPRLARLLAVFESFTVATALNAFSLFLVPTEVGFGQSFEFCDAGANKEKARKFVEHMLGTYEPSKFVEIARRPSCAKAMLGHLESQ